MIGAPVTAGRGAGSGDAEFPHRRLGLPKVIANRQISKEGFR